MVDNSYNISDLLLFLIDFICVIAAVVKRIVNR